MSRVVLDGRARKSERAKKEIVRDRKRETLTLRDRCINRRSILSTTERRDKSRRRNEEGNYMIERSRGRGGGPG